MSATQMERMDKSEAKPITPERRPHKAAAWRKRLFDDDAGDRGALARLRRASTVSEAWSEPVTARLYDALGFTREERDKRMEVVGLLAILLAHIREDAGGHGLGAALGGPTPAMSALRVRRLASARDAGEALRGFREAIALLKNTAPVVGLAESVLGWLDPDRREATRTRFLFDYHGAGAAAPKSLDDASAESQETL
jgi:CRISPR system Cascade subunit CasB